MGKSSLINALAGRRIARSGAKPGTTRLLNVYRFSRALPRRPTFVIVDLPGYGYARGGDRSRREFERLTDQFFQRLSPAGSVDRPGTTAPRLAGVLLVIDARHPGLDSDLAAWRWLTELGHPTLVVITKIDRVPRSKHQHTRAQHMRAVGHDVLLVSARTKLGIPQLWARLGELLV